MKTKSKWLLTAAFAMLIALSIGMTVTAASAAEVSLVKLDAYEQYEIPSDLNHEAEFNKGEAANDEGKRLDYGLRIPSNNGVMNGVAPTSPQTPLGNGVNVAPGIAKVKFGYGGGGMYLRYGYAVDMSSTRIDMRFLDFDNVDGRVIFAFSSEAGARIHPSLSYPGFRVNVYKEGAYMKVAVVSGDQDKKIPGLEDKAFDISLTDNNTWCFSMLFAEGDNGTLDMAVTNGTVTHTFNIPKEYVDGTKITEDHYEGKIGQTYISLTSSDGKSDPDGLGLTMVLKISDNLRTQYENDTMIPVKTALEAYSVSAIDAATVSTIEDVNGWIAKREAIDQNKVAKLRVADRDLLQVSANIAAANAKLKEKAGNVVNGYVTELLNTLDTEFATAKSDTEFTTITTEEERAALSDKYSAAWIAYNNTYKDLIVETAEQKEAKTTLLAGVGNARDRLNAHIAIYLVEHADMTTAAAVAAAEAEYAKINTDDFKNKISALNTTEAIKTALTTRLNGIADIIETAKGNLDKSAIIEEKVKAYEDAAITTIAELRAALEVKELIDDYSDLDASVKSGFDARIAAKDTAIQNKAYEIIKPSVDEVKALTDKGVKSYRDSKAVKTAIAAIQNTDLLAAEKLEEVNATIADAQAKAAAVDNALDESNWKVGNAEGQEAHIDVELATGGVKYYGNGYGDTLLYDKKFDLTEDGISVKFSVEEWAYMNGDGSRKTGNNATIVFAASNKNGANIVGRTQNTLSVMYWTQVEEFFVKTYANGANTEADSDTMKEIGAGNGSYVIVTLKKNAAQQRFEILTTCYAANGEEIDGGEVRNLIDFSAADEHMFDNGVYVAFVSYMDVGCRDNDNVWLITEIGGDSFAGGVPVTGITVNSDKTSIAVGETAQLSVTVSPDNASDKTVTYTSSDNGIATVDENGKVTAVKEGTVMITAKSGNQSASVTIRVTAAGTEEPADEGCGCGGTVFGGGYALLAILLLVAACVAVSLRKKA